MTQRHHSDDDGETLAENDQISRRLVANVYDELGKREKLYPESCPKTQFVIIAHAPEHHDVSNALMWHSKTEQFVVAHRWRDPMNQKEKDWQIDQVGDMVDLVEIHELERPENEQDQDPQEYAQDWIEIIFQDIAISNGKNDYSDPLQMLNSSRLKIGPDHDNRKLEATIRLVKEE